MTNRVGQSFLGCVVPFQFVNHNSSIIKLYKSADLCSRLTKLGIDVHVIMTENATQLVQPRVFQTMTRHDVTTTLWTVDRWEPGHTALADKADLFVVAPATANTIGLMANGIAPDALSTFALAHHGPTIVCPAMNPHMWANPAVQANLDTLRGRGVTVVDPASGVVACGDVGPGKLADIDVIVCTIQAQLAVLDCPRPDRRLNIVVTSGPTVERIDPVRFLTNRSSGKMGYSIAAAAVALGHEVTLITGPTTLSPPAGVKVAHVGSAAEMLAAVTARMQAHADALIMAAAVADFTPLEPFEHKIKKAGGVLDLQLTKTIDILATIGQGPLRPAVLGGFAAESRDIAHYAQDKLRRKGLDFIVANDISQEGRGFGADHNEVTIYRAVGGEVHVPHCHKMDVAAEVMRVIQECIEVKLLDCTAVRGALAMGIAGDGVL